MRWHRCLKMTIQFHLTKNGLGFLCAAACFPEMKQILQIVFQFWRFFTSKLFTPIYTTIRTEKTQVKSYKSILLQKKNPTFCCLNKFLLWSNSFKGFSFSQQVRIIFEAKYQFLETLFVFKTPDLTGILSQYSIILL